MEQKQVGELCSVYDEMDTEGKMQLIKIAGKFLEVQKILEDEKSSLQTKDEGAEMKNEKGAKKSKVKEKGNGEF